MPLVHRAPRSGRYLSWLGLAQALIAAFGLAHAASTFAFGLVDVTRRAQMLAQTAYQGPGSSLPKEMRDLKYDEYRDIRFRPDHALWRADKLPFELMFFHPGGNYEPVRINEVRSNQVRAIPFDPKLYDYGRNQIDEAVLGELGHAGFRVHYAMNLPDYKDEVLVFLGASYFRAVGKDQVYGLSARGLAVDVAEPGGEEFPRFAEFWVERPSPKATSLTIYALLDSRRLTGAYRFELVPGVETVMNVQAVVYQREGGRKVGLTPLTSMFHFGENQPGRDDYRPEVHDSDGLALHTSDGEWLWRPLVNPQNLLVTSFATADPVGFGLLQRDRAFASYEDPEALYDRRPSAWIEPSGKWGAGRVELVQIPTPDETNDNIVVYWVPEKMPPPREPLPFAYTVHWQLQGAVRPPHAWVTQTRRGRGYVKQPDGQLKFVVDFDGPAIRSLGSDALLEPAVSVGGNGELMERNLFKNQVNGLWRMTVRVRRIDAAKPTELRASLRQGQKVLSETWSYIVPPQREKEKLP